MHTIDRSNIKLEKLPRQKKINNAFIELVDGIEMITCNTCGSKKEVNEDNFIKRSDNKLGWRRQCRCCVKYRRSINEYTEEGILKKSNEQLKIKFGLTRTELEAIYIAQNMSCKICGTEGLVHGIKKSYKDKIKTLHVDHCHATGKIRGLLCNSCNVAMGMMNDDIDIMKNAIKYIEESSVC